MFVVWATDKEPETNKLGIKLLQGVAYGTGVGFAYGLWDANRDSGLISQRRGLLPVRCNSAPAHSCPGRGLSASTGDRGTWDKTLLIQCQVLNKHVPTLGQ